MLKGRKIIFKKRQPIEIEKVVPVISSSLAGFDSVQYEKMKEDVTNKNDDKKEVVKNNVVKQKGSKAPATIFMIIILILGFYVIYDQFIITKETNNNSSTTNATISKIYSSKDYVYFENEKDISFPIDNNVKYQSKDIVINLNSDSAKSLTLQLNNETKEEISNYKYSTDTSDKCLASTSIYNTSTKYLKSFTYRDYAVYESVDYISIVVKDTQVNICNDDNTETIKSYVIDRKEGIIYNDTSLMKLYNTSLKELVTKAISGRTDDDYGKLDSSNIVDSILDINEINLYIDNRNCLGIYYTGIMNSQKDDHNHISLVCK